MDAGLTFLLKTNLAKSSKETVVMPQTISMPKDSSRLKKHITIVCDRLAKGAGFIALRVLFQSLHVICCSVVASLTAQRSGLPMHTLSLWKRLLFRPARHASVELT